MQIKVLERLVDAQIASQAFQRKLHMESEHLLVINGWKFSPGVIWPTWGVVEALAWIYGLEIWFESRGSTWAWEKR